MPAAFLADLLPELPIAPPLILAAPVWLTDFWALVVERAPKLWELTVDHLVFLTLIPVGIAICVGVPLGVLISRVPWLRGPVLGTVGMIQTLPSLALLALFIPLLGVGKQNAIVALTLYALLPIVMNTTTGLTGVPEEAIEAARGMGFTTRQRLLMVRLPLALPVIIAGIRTAAVIDVGIATLAALVGAGGLGDFIIRGLSMNNWQLTTLGALAAVVLALLVFFTIGVVEKLLSKGPKRASPAN